MKEWIESLASDTGLSESLVFLLLILLVAAVAFPVIVILIRRSYSRQKLESSFRSELHKTIRNEAIDRALNNYVKSGIFEHWIIKINETNHFNNKEYFFNMKDEIKIGRDFQSNTLCLYDEKADNRQGKFLLRKNMPVYINLSDKTPTYIICGRKHGRTIPKKYQLRRYEETRIFSKDKIVFGNTEMELNLFNENEGLY